MTTYKYRPWRFYITAFAVTWAFWIVAIFLSKNTAYDGLTVTFMLLGLLSPATIAIITVLTSKSPELKADLKRKLVGFYRVKPLSILIGVFGFAVIVVLSILLSHFFGQSIKDQFRFTEDFSFSIGGTSALLTIFLAATIEEVGWRGYGEDSVAAYNSWFKESIIFGTVWALWHLPLFWINGTYHYGLLHNYGKMGILFMLNFLISVNPMGFLTTWVYVHNKRSMLASIIFHLFVNTMQEKIAMTPETKCVETLVVFAAAALVVLTNKDMFFEKRHIGNLLEENLQPENGEKL